MTVATLSCYTYNVRGLRDDKKRGAVYKWLLAKNCDVILLQETHCHHKKEEIKWGREWGGQSFWSRGTSHSKGVTVLFNPKVNYSLSDIDIDPNGRYIRVKVDQDGSFYQVINIYSPNNEYERVCFIKQIGEWLVNMEENTEAVIGGDFNCVLSNQLDRLNCRDSTDIGQIDLHHLNKSCGLQDVWRRRNPTAKGYEVGDLLS